MDRANRSSPKTKIYPKSKKTCECKRNDSKRPLCLVVQKPRKYAQKGV